MSTTRKNNISEHIEVLATAALAECGISIDALSQTVEQHDPQKVCNIAESNEFRGITLKDALVSLVESSGVSHYGRWDVASLWETAREIKSEANIQSDLGTLLDRITNKSMQAAYSTVPRAFRDLALRLPDLTNTKATDHYAVTPEMMGQSGPDGEVSDAKYHVENYGSTPMIFAEKLVMTEQMVFNDDLQTFLTGSGTSVTGLQLHASAWAKRIEFQLAALICEAFAAAVTDRTADAEFLFANDDAANKIKGNILGAGNALSVETLQSAERKMGAQVDRAGDTIDLHGTHLLTTSGNRTLARQLARANEVEGRTFSPMPSSWWQHPEQVSPVPDQAWALVHSSQRTAPISYRVEGSNEAPRVEYYGDISPDHIGYTSRASGRLSISMHDPRAIVAYVG